jgi:HEAT repeat protein
MNRITGFTAGLLVCLISATTVALPDSMESELTPEIKKHLQADEVTRKQAALLSIAYVENDKLAKQRDQIAKQASNTKVRAAGLLSQILEGKREAMSPFMEVVAKGQRPDRLLDRALLTVPPATQKEILKKAASHKKLRPAALQYLGEADGAMYQLLGRYLKSSNDKLAEEAAKVISQYPRIEAIDAVEGLLSSDLDQALNLAMSLSQWPHMEEEVVGLLESALEIADASEKRAKVAKRLLEMGKLEDPSVLVERFFTKPADRQRLGKTLLNNGIELPTSKIKKAKKAAKETRLKGLLWEMKAVAGEVQVPKLKKMFKSTDFEKRIFAVRAMGRLNDAAAVSLLGEGLFEGNDQMRLYSARALKHIASEEAIPPLERALDKEKNIRVKVAVIEALGQIGTDKALKLLQFNINSPKVKIKRAILNAFRTTSGDIPESAVAMRLTDRKPQIRMLAFEVLYKRAGETALNRMSTILQQPPMGFYGKLLQYPPTTHRTEIFNKLTRLDDRFARQKALDNMKRIPSQFLGLLAKTAQSSDVPKSTRLAALRYLAKHNRSDDRLLFGTVTRKGNNPAQLRQTAAWALTQYQSADSEASFRGYLSDDSKIIQAIAVYGLASIDR